jgi:hypothetical protein
MLPTLFVTPSPSFQPGKSYLKLSDCFHAFSRYHIHSLLKQAQIPRMHSQTQYSKIIRLGDLHYCEGFIELQIRYSKDLSSTMIFFSHDEETYWRGWNDNFNVFEIKEFVQSWQDYYATLNDLLSMLQNSGFIMKSED